MIKINLLPPHLRPIKRTPLPHLASLLVLVLVLAGMAQVFVVNVAAISKEKTAYKDVEDRFNALSETVNKYNKIQEGKEELQAKVEVIREIIEDRIIWSYQLHLLTSAIPDNIWLSGIEEKKKKKLMRVQQIDSKTNLPAVDPKTKEPIFTKRSIDIPILEIQGYINEDEAGEIPLPKFIESLELPPFADRFDYEWLGTGFDEINDVQVKTFVLEYQITTGGAEDV